MSNEKTNNEENPAEAEKTLPGGASNGEIGVIGQANQAAERLEAANKERALILEKEQQLYAKNLLAGRSEGVPTQQRSEEQEKKAKAIEFFKGTEIAKAIEKYG
jgi:hypothetical protein